MISKTNQISNGVKELFSKKWFIVFVLISLLFFQLIYSFLFPPYGLNDNWQPVSTYLPKFTVESTDNFILGKIYPFVSPEYRLNSDVGNYLELAQNFNSRYFEHHVFLNRPLYPFLIFLSSLPLRLFTEPSYGLIFALAIFVNFILISLAVLLFFYFLRKLFSSKVAWLSSILLIFSPFVHSYLIQPLAEMFMALAVVLSAYLLYNYIRKPSFPKLIVFSLIIGTLMLGKMFFAISFFILILSLYFRRYKEGFTFLIIHLVPFLLWYLWITQVWQISYFSLEIQRQNMGVWLFSIFQWPWYEITRVFFTAIPNFITALIYSFILIPIIFSVIGLKLLPFKSKNIIYFSSLFSVLALSFLTTIYLYRHAFLLFPIIYPTCILGIERVAGFLKRYQSWYSCLFYVIIISLIIFVSNINIHEIFHYLEL